VPSQYQENGDTTDVKTAQQLQTDSPDRSLPAERRRFIKGIATGAVLITVASRPAMGAWCTPSAWVSGNLSAHDDADTCGGRSPGYWATQPDRWPPQYRPGTCDDDEHGTCKKYESDGTPFHNITNSAGLTGPFYNNGTFKTLTMMQVLWLGGGGDAYQLGAHLCAALLNAATIPNYGMDEATVKEIWRQLATQGYYQPSVGTPMYPQDVVAFIKNTF
jgi:hypothetical protein